LEKFKPHCLVGIPVQMLRLAENISHLRPKTVLLSADYVPTAVRNRISALWDCLVYAHYGLTESGLGGAVECGAHAGYHIRHNDLLFEIINPTTGRPLPDGETGEIVISTLTRETMPLIRYRTGDIACLLNNKCPCGSPLKRLGKIEGRYCDVVSIGEGEMISLPMLDEILFAMPAVLDYTASLNRDSEKWLFTIKILSGEHIDIEHIKNYLQGKIDIDLQIEFYSSDSFMTDGRHKRKLITEGKDYENICSGN
jgi:phenylacetate-CoA ligase